MRKENRFKRFVLTGLAVSLIFTGGVGSAFAKGEAVHSSSSVMLQGKQEAKYSKQVMRKLREELGFDKKSTVHDSKIESMPKVKVMDLYLTSFGKKIKGKEVRKAVEEVFFVDLDIISKNNYGSQVSIYPEQVMNSLRLSFNEKADSTKQDARIMKLKKSEVMDRYIKEQGEQLTGAESRILINQIFGVNLDGISTLEYSQLAISSKGQWILKSDTDLFILESSLDDVDVSVYATPYFEQVTGSNKLPESLKTKLMSLGFKYNEEKELLYYINPTGESVPDAFKGQVLGIIVGTIMGEYK
ncbi:hypothetical protein [Planococcus sp. 107-1]|uniref:hypothetical protein n=1 Tax=Planococcus sp. 107-1 TaxID=2908840 RepID=UPI001F1BB02E|nr:hypothetical protein [Planococcus sp. 107-1]UJF27626.1 hypothetical protein L0M13_03945 [Planococcus sp. 107-1]